MTKAKARAKTKDKTKAKVRAKNIKIKVDSNRLGDPALVVGIREGGKRLPIQAGTKDGVARVARGRATRAAINGK